MEMCGRCKGYVDEGLQCDACQRWFHMQCEQVSQKEYKRISDMGTSVMWLSQRCKVNFQNMAGKNRELKDENKELRRRMDSLEEKIRNLKGEIVEETITEVMRRRMENESKKQDPEIINGAVESNDIEKQVNEYISNAREEDRDKERRKNNLILFNVNESRKETQTAKNEDDEA